MIIWLLVVGLVVIAAVAAVFFVVRRRPQPAPQPVPIEAPPTADDIRRELADLLGSMVGKVSPDVLARYEAVHRRMLAMLPRMGRLEGSSQDLFILYRTAADYLPTAVRSYLSVSAAGGAERALPDGRTPRQAVLEQLDLIDTRLADITDALDQSDLDRLLAHGRFLETRFGDGLAPKP